jgi:hypothetical protein
VASRSQKEAGAPRITEHGQPCWFVVRSSVTIPNSVTALVDYAFNNCASLQGVYFKGNALSLGSYVFSGDTNTTIYYLSRTTDWDTTFGDISTAPWLPQVQSSNAAFGVQTNQFEFDINWASGQTVVVEACTDLADPIWTSVGTNTLTGGSSYFSDLQWRNYPDRFYRLRSP